MAELLQAPAFWLAVSIGAYTIGQRVQQATRSPLCNPLLIAGILVGALLLVTHTTLETYNSAGALLSFCLTPATVALAVPIYRQFDLLRQHALPIFIGALTGCCVSIASVFLLCRLFGITDEILYSLIPKSVTTPIGVALSEMLGGITAVTTIMIVFTGIVGAIILPPFLRLLGFRDPVVFGLAMGTAAHSVGTSRAIEIGETEGAISGLAIGVAGIITSFLVTLLHFLL